MTDALANLLIEKASLGDAEFEQKLLQERAVYQRILNPPATIITKALQCIGQTHIEGAFMFEVAEAKNVKELDRARY